MTQIFWSSSLGDKIVYRRHFGSPSTLLGDSYRKRTRSGLPFDVAERNHHFVQIVSCRTVAFMPRPRGGTAAVS